MALLRRGLLQLQIVKLNSNREIQGYVSNSNVDFQLLGYTVGSDPAYLMAETTDQISDIRVSSNDDDAEECLTDNSVVTDSIDLDIVIDTFYCGPGDNQEIGLRFQSLSIPPGVTVTNGSSACSPSPS